MRAGEFQYSPTGSAWTYAGSAGLAANGSGFTGGNPTPPKGVQVAFLQDTGSFSQAVAGWAAGSYQLTFYAAQRGNAGTSRQDFQRPGRRQRRSTPSPPPGTSYRIYTTAGFTRHRRVAHGHLPGARHRGGDNTAFIDAVAISPVDLPILRVLSLRA